VKETEENIKQEFYIPNLRVKIEKCIASCLKCILCNKKTGRKEGLLHPLTKENVPLHTYHINHLGPFKSTNKNYKHNLAVIDFFTKFVWYPMKSTTSKEIIKKLELQKWEIFGSPSCIISDREVSFTSAEFKNYCRDENIKHVKITAGLPRANDQIERVNCIIILMLPIIPVIVVAKMSLEEPTNWYQHVPELQQTLNATYQRSINTLWVINRRWGPRMRNAIEQEMIRNFWDSRQ